MNSQINLSDESNIERIKRICNGVLFEVAPEELILVDQVVDVFVAKPIEQLKEPETDNGDFSDMPLGFDGGGELYAAILVPIIISVLSKMLTTFSDENLKQAIDIIQGKKNKQELKVEITVNEIRQEITVLVSKRDLTKKKSKIIADKILRSIARELSE